MIGEEALRIFNTFTFADEEKDKLNLIIEKFDAHCNPKKTLQMKDIFSTLAHRMDDLSTHFSSMS